MYLASPLVSKAVTLGLVSPRAARRIERRVRRRSRDLIVCDLLWAEELRRSRQLTRYQAQTLLAVCEAANAPDAESSAEAASPLQIGPHTVLDRVGRSDLGSTYRCRRADGRELWAIKLLDSAWGEHEENLARVTAEVEAWNGLGDPHIATQQLVPLPPGKIAVARAWIAGTSLAEWLRAGQRPTPDAALAIIRELIGSLAVADSRGLVHGDLKPANVFIDRRGRVLLVDSGLRRVVAGAELAATRDLPPECCDCVAPEVAAAAPPPDAASDIYSLGCIFYHLLTGRPPFGGGDAERKLAAHRAGRLIDPKLLGIEIGVEHRLLLKATLVADRTSRAGSYNELLTRLPPLGSRRLRAVGVVRHGGAIWPGHTPRVASAEHARNRWAKLLFGAAATAAIAVALVHGGRRLMPILNLRPITQSTAVVPVAARKDARNAATPRAVTALWNATEDLRVAYRAAAPHDTITLKSPGPFLLDAIDLAKPITLRGADAVWPLFVGGPGSALRITADDVRLENVHFLRVAEPLTGQNRHDARAMLDVAGDRLTLERCSFQDTSAGSELAAAVAWRPARPGDATTAASLTGRNLFFRHVSAAVAIEAGGSLVNFENCVHHGPGPLIVSASARGRPFEAFELTLSDVTVFGASTLVHEFPHPLDDAVPLRVSARRSLLVPRDREQPIVEIRYAAQPGTLMPKVSWSGSDSVCPADATTVQVRRGPSAAPWRAADIAAWNAYWGSHATGLTGARIDFASGSDSSSTRPSAPIASGAGANPETLLFPPDVAIEQLPVMLERLNHRTDLSP